MEVVHARDAGASCGMEKCAMGWVSVGIPDEAERCTPTQKYDVNSVFKGLIIEIVRLE